MHHLMEGSTLHYSMNKPIFSKGEGGTPPSSGEESGWTSYFEEFMESQKKKMEEEEEEEEEGGSSCFSCIGNGFSPPPPPISDAGSCTLPALVEERFVKKLRFKKRKKIGGVLILNVEDDSLQDTATSPFRTPKATRTVISNQLESRRKEMSSTGVGVADEIHESIELKGKGLCLVPMSMLVDYL